MGGLLECERHPMGPEIYVYDGEAHVRNRAPRDQMIKGRCSLCWSPGPRQVFFTAWGGKMHVKDDCKGLRNRASELLDVVTCLD